MARRTVYPPEFRRRITEPGRAGRGLNSIAKEFGIARGSIVNWLKQDDLDTGRRETSAHSRDISRDGVLMGEASAEICLLFSRR
jgi:transposase-like protein